MPTDADWQATFDLQNEYVFKLERWLLSLGVDVHVDTFEDTPPVVVVPPVEPPPVVVPPVQPPPVVVPPVVVPPVKPPPVTPPPPPPPPGKTLLGISGTAVIAGATDRIFYTSSKTVAQRRPKAQCPRVHVSWKVLGEAPLTDAQFKATVVNLLPGDKVEYEHETDAKWRKDGNAANLASRLKAKNYLYDQVKRVRPDLVVVNTLTSYAFEGALFKDATKYDAKADVLGADLDGGAFPHDYGDPARLANIVSHAKAHYGGRWTVPEFGWNNDPAGGRMPTITKQLTAIAKAGPEEINFHDNPSFGAVLTAAEIVEFTKLIHAYNG